MPDEDPTNPDDTRRGEADGSKPADDTDWETFADPETGQAETHSEHLPEGESPTMDRILQPAGGGSGARTPYRLLQRIGVGGMGEVWLAEQDKPIRRRVALKLIRGGFGSKEVIARFESERQALAMMEHPGIARVFDAGATSPWSTSRATPSPSTAIGSGPRSRSAST